MSGFRPFGANGNRGPLGERLFDRPIRTQEQLAAELALTHPAAQCGVEMTLPQEDPMQQFEAEFTEQAPADQLNQPR